jgi:hypothetical protein
VRAPPTATPGAATRDAAGEGAASPARLRCAACGAAITDREAAITIQGAHAHHFVNPHGLAFHVGVSARAPGCRVSGPATAFYSWFPGLPWRLAACAGCGAHLGWGYGATLAFYGLILDRLREAEDPG